MNLTIPIPRRVLDIFEQAVVLVLYAWMIARLLPDDFSSSNWYLLLILFSEGIVVVLLVFRRRTERISVNLADWVLAFGGTFAVLLIAKGNNDPITAVGGVSLLLIGLCVHVSAKLMLLRSFGLVAADRGVKSGGLYAFVRHPMYLGYLLTHIGFLLVAPSVWNASVYLLAWPMMIARIYAEERVLDANPDYQAFKAHVRYRLLPGIF
jgi:protein-S-isoprenylcysteine O-methyltransferase Ste14